MKKKLVEYQKTKQAIVKLGLIKKGSITERWHVCGTPNCKCKKDDKFRHGPHYWLTWKETKKTKSVLVPKELIKEVEEYRNNYGKLKALILNMEKLSEEIIKEKIAEIRKHKV